MDQELVTMLLTLKGRHVFTERWLKYASRQNFQFQIFIADGSLEDEAGEIIDRHLKNDPSLKVTYRRFPPDNTYPDYYAKLCLALSEVKTKYVIFADNDDFYVSSGIQAAAEFLEENDGYTCCGGDMRHFIILNDPPIYASKAFHYCSYGKIPSLDQDTAEERVLAHGQNYRPTYYHVWRTGQILEYCTLVKEKGFKDVTFFELLPSMMGVAQGKTKVLEQDYLFRQQNSFDTASGSLRSQNQIDRMIANSWSEELEFVKIKIARVIRDVDGSSFDDALNITERAISCILETRILRDNLSDALRHRRKVSAVLKILKILSPYKHRVIASLFHKVINPSIGKLFDGNKAFSEIRYFLKNASQENDG